MAALVLVAAGIGASLGFYSIYKYLQRKESSGYLVMVSAEVAEYQHFLKNQYKDIEKKFKIGNLNLSYISSIRKYYHGLDDKNRNDTLEPKHFYEINPPLKKHCCRLVVIPLSDSGTLTDSLYVVSRDILNLLPANFKVYLNKKENYHITIFHLSRYDEPATDPSENTIAAVSASDMQMPSTEILTLEESSVKSIVEGIGSPLLYLERIQMADSGTLLALWIDKGANIKSMRDKLKKTFPGAPKKQTNIIHSSLLRIVTDEKLDDETMEKINSACEKWTEKLKGVEYKPEVVWLISEYFFSCIEGDRQTIKFT